jgi:hypothetical protein
VSDGATVRVYLNGVAYGNVLNLPLGAVTSLLQVGSWPSGGSGGPFVDFFGGRIDEVRVYGRALSAAEIQNDANTPVPGP